MGKKQMFDSSKYMKLALEKAMEAVSLDEVPVGAIIVYKGEVVGAAHNLTRQLCDPTAHAEVMAIRQAGAFLSQDKLTDCDMYVTLEPCPMCAHAISLARIRRLYFGAYDAKGGGVENGAKIFSASSCHHAVEYYGGVLEEESSALLKQFFLGKR